MYILHIETSTKICSVALSRGEDLIQCIDYDDGMNHTAVLAPSIQQLLSSAGIRPADLRAVSISSGPGSYTGLRVGSSTGKAMAYSLNIHVLGIPTLSSLAQAAFTRHPEAEFALPMLDARRNEVYTSLYDREMNQVIPDSSVILEGSGLEHLISPGRKIVSCGDGAVKLMEYSLSFPLLILDLEIRSSARHLIGLAYTLLSSGKSSDPMHFVPYYLKPPNITQQKKR